MHLHLLKLSSFYQDFKVLEEPSNHLLAYIATSLYSKGFNRSKCYARLKFRVPYNAETNLMLNLCPTETNIFNARFDLINSNNRAYEIATKSNPTVTELEEFAMLRPCWSNIFPVKAMLTDHVELAKNYRGLQPFGKYVISFFNEVLENNGEEKVKNSPDFKDHIRLRDFTNKMSDILEIPTPTLNSMMYMEGMELEGVNRESGVTTI